MRYKRPQITRIVNAVSVIKSAKGAGNQEVGTIFLTNGSAYQSDE